MDGHPLILLKHGGPSRKKASLYGKVAQIYFALRGSFLLCAQHQEVLDTIDCILKEHGSSKDRILSCQIFLSDMRLFSKMNEVWDSWVAKGNAPARATVEARLASPEKLIEICVIAAN